MADLAAPGRHRGEAALQNWMSQIVIGVVVTVIGTVVAHVVVKGMGGKGLFGGDHYSGPARGGR